MWIQILTVALVALFVAVVVLYTRFDELRRRFESQERALARLLPTRPEQPEPTAVVAAAVASASTTQSHQAAPTSSESRGDEPRNSAVPPPLPAQRQLDEPNVAPRFAPIGDFAARSLAIPAQAAAPQKFQWERWLGVRGFAVLGGVAAALAALLFFQYAIDHGWITERLRVALGIGGGVAALITGDRLWLRRFRWAPQALIGAGLVALYAASWAASERYGLWSQPLSWSVMAATTAVGCWLALRHDSALIASLGMLGGFATPVVVSSSNVNPYAFFGYVLLLDIGLVLLGRARNWPLLGLLALVGTAALEILWLKRSYSPAEHLLFLVVLGLFALTFALRERPGSALCPYGALTRGLGILLPFAFALHLLTHGEVAPNMWSTAALALLLITGAMVVSKQRGLAALPALSALLWLALMSAWIEREQRLDLQFTCIAIAMSVLPTIGLAVVRRRESRVAGTSISSELPVETQGPDKHIAALGLAAAIALAGHGVLLVIAAGANTVVLGALAAVAFTLVLLGTVVARLRSVAWIATAVAGLGATSLVRLLAITEGPSTGSADAWVQLGVVLAFVAFCHAASQWSARSSRTDFERALAALAAFASTTIPLGAFETLGARVGNSTALACGLYALLLAALLSAAVRTGFGWTMLIALVAARLGATGLWTHDAPLGVQLIGAATMWFAALAFVVAARRPQLLPSKMATVSVCAALLLFFVASYLALEWPLGRGGELALGLPFVALGAWAAYTGVGRQRGAGLGLATVAAVILAAAVAREVDIEPVIMGGALFTLALSGATFSSRLNDRRLLRLGALTPLAICIMLALRLIGLPPHAVPQNVFFSGLSLAHCVPALAATLLVRRFRVLAPNEKVLPISTACVAAVDVFMWLTALVLGHFATTSTIDWPAAGKQTVQLALSLTWITYALALVAVGMKRGVAGWRWASLAVLLVTIGKVFLVDLGDLEGLMRVASLAGLGLTLILVSLLYQRFVFQREPSVPATTPQG